jgi:uncharacterized membrane protein
VYAARPAAHLARELAALRFAVGKVATRDYLRRELDESREVIDQSQPESSKTEPARKADLTRRRANGAP